MLPNIIDYLLKNHHGIWPFKIKSLSLVHCMHLYRFAWNWTILWPGVQVWAHLNVYYMMLFAYQFDKF
jgi:hypothetical protein